MQVYEAMRTWNNAMTSVSNGNGIIPETDKLLELGRVNRVVHDTRVVVGPRIQKAGLAGLTKRAAVVGVGPLA
ncbi:hypothetical protein Tco_0443766, partial [Tanacetum coccineum]